MNTDGPNKNIENEYQRTQLPWTQRAGNWLSSFFSSIAAGVSRAFKSIGFGKPREPSAPLTGRVSVPKENAVRLRMDAATGSILRPLLRIDLAELDFPNKHQWLLAKYKEATPVRE